MRKGTPLFRFRKFLKHFVHYYLKDRNW